MIIGLTKGRPYVLRIRNADDTNRNFKAGEFFRSVALSRVAINGREKKANCITGVTVKPNQGAELELVAVRHGRYEFEDGYLSFIHGMAGVIHINLPVAPIIQKARYAIRSIEFQPSVRPAPQADDGPGVSPAVPTTTITPDLPRLPDLPDLPAIPTQKPNSTWKLPTEPF
jgi:hypothetical protein